MAPPRPLFPLAGALAVWIAGALLSAAPAHARSFYVRSITATEVSQMRRLDGLTLAPRPLIQGLELRGYDLLDTQDGSLAARASVRYVHDFGLATDPSLLASERATQLRDNDLRLDQLALTWRPARWLQLDGGRHGIWSALGTHDVDGLTLTLVPWRDGARSLSMSASFGRDPQLGWSLLASDHLDVQGMPLPQDLGAPLGVSDEVTPWIVHAQTQLGLGSSLRASIAYQRRWRQQRGSDQTILGSERAALGLSSELPGAVALSAQASYHTLLRRPDVLAAQAAWRLPTDTWRHDLSLGVGRRAPWFDSVSIFNLFGANPYDEASLQWRGAHPSGSWRIGARTWARAFHGDEDTLDLAQGASDAHALGAGVDHGLDWRFGPGRATWHSALSAQRGSEDYGGDQWLARTSVRLPVLKPNWLLDARLLGLWVDQRDGGPRPRDEAAMSAILGVDLGLLDGRAELRALVEQRLAISARSSTNLYAVFEWEIQ